MSHRDDCPDRWTAEDEGERAQEYGRGRFANPYDDPFHSGHGCEEAARSWDDGFRRAERHEEDRREEEDAERRAAIRRQESAAEEEYYAQQDYESEDEPPEPSERELCESNAHCEYPDGTDRFGRRCYCGLVRYLAVVPVTEERA